MPDTTICIFCESGDHEHPAYDARVMRCGCACHLTVLAYSTPSAHTATLDQPASPH